MCGWRFVVLAEDPEVLIGIFVTRVRVRIEPQRLVIADRERRLLRDVGLEQLRAPPAVIRLDQVEHAVVQQAGEDDLLGHAGLHRARRALQHVIGRREAEPEEILERRILRHRLELLDVAASGYEQAAGAAAIVARFDLRFDLGDGRELLALALDGGDLLVELFFHPVLEGVGLGLGVHQADGGRATKTGDERSAIYLHAVLPCIARHYDPFARSSGSTGAYFAAYLHTLGLQVVRATSGRRRGRRRWRVFRPETPFSTRPAWPRGPRSAKTLFLPLSTSWAS